MRYLLLFLVVVMSCQPQGKKEFADLFIKAKDLGTVDQVLEEASGLVESVTNPHHLWTLNDSGNPPDVFLIDEKANIKLICTLAKVRNRDFEDIAIGAGPDKSKSYVYVGDIGDNFEQYKYKYIYRFEEPVLTDSTHHITITKFDVLVIRLPDGIRDSETLMIDPLSNDLYLISKREDAVHLYLAKYPFKSDTLKLKFVTELPFTRIVAGGISQDGKEIILKDYNAIYYWHKKGNESIPDLLKENHVEIEYKKEPQGEAMTWARDGSGFYTLSESVKDLRGKLYFYQRK